MQYEDTLNVSYSLVYILYLQIVEKIFMSDSGVFLSLLADELNEKVKQGYRIIDIRRADESYFSSLTLQYTISCPL